MAETIEKPTENDTEPIRGVRALGRELGRSHSAVSTNWLAHSEWPWSRRGPWPRCQLEAMRDWGSSVLRQMDKPGALPEPRTLPGGNGFSEENIEAARERIKSRYGARVLDALDGGTVALVVLGSRVARAALIVEGARQTGAYLTPFMPRDWWEMRICDAPADAIDEFSNELDRAIDTYIDQQFGGRAGWAHLRKRNKKQSAPPAADAVGQQSNTSNAGKE